MHRLRDRGRTVRRAPAPGRADPAAAATWDYWQGLNRVGQRTKKFENVDTAGKSPDQIARLLRDAAAALQGVRADISGLAVRDVDAEAVGYGAETVELAGLAQAL